MNVAQKVDLMTDIVRAGFAGIMRINTKSSPRVPAWTHSIRVMLMLQSYGYHHEIFLGGGAHDLLEDTIITYEFLVRNFNKRVADLAAACTFKAELGDTAEGQEELFKRVVGYAEAGDKDPLRIKVADSMDNNRNISSLGAKWAPELLRRGFLWLHAAEQHIPREALVEDFRVLLNREKKLMNI